jgi:adenylate cyclase
VIKWVFPLALPLALVILLRSAPAVDARWEDRPAHFWIVLAAGVLNGALALAITEAGRRRRDARLLLIGLAFLVSAGFLGLHALATPGEIVSGANAGFVLATPVGLVLSGVLTAASAVEYGLEASLKIVRHSRALTAAALGVIVA